MKTPMTGTNSERFDSGRSIAEKLQATVQEKNDQTWFVDYGEEATIEPRSRFNDLLFDAEDERRETLYDLLVYGEPFEAVDVEKSGILKRLSDKTFVEVSASDNGNHLLLSVDGDETYVPGDRRADVIETILEHEKAEAASELARIAEEIEEGYVRRQVVEQFLDRFDDERVRVATNGWVIDESYVVQYDAENYHVDDPGTFEQTTSGVKAVDDDHEFIKLSFPQIDGKIDEQTPDGDYVTLDEQEQRFLATVTVLLDPARYLGHDDAGRVVENRIGTPEGASNAIEDIATSASEEAFKDEEGQVHKHTLGKHTLRKNHNVTEETIDRLHHQQNSHVGINEFVRRENEFRRADFDVFYDTDNDDDERWNEVNEAAKSADISARTRRRLDSMFGGA